VRSSARSLGVCLGELPIGRWNDITDVPGVLVGHATLVSGDGALQPGQGPVRTGITIIRPHSGNIFTNKVPAAVHTINGFGKVTGFEQVRELGWLEAPIALTNTLNVGLVLDALVELAIKENPEIGITTATVNILVGETNDGYLNDIQGRHVRKAHVWQAYESASPGPIEQGAVGAGTGTVCFGWKGGIGSASRVLSTEYAGYTVGALVQSNFGKQSNLVIAGIPVGKELSLHSSRTPGMDNPFGQADRGSIMMILATDAPVDVQLLERICRRAAAGLARSGSMLGPQSGDFVVAFSTANRIQQEPQGYLKNQPTINYQPFFIDNLFQAVIETVEEAVINSLFFAETVRGRDGHIAEALPIETVLRLFHL